MTEHTNEEWRRVLAGLRKIADDPSESKSRRDKAQGVLNRINRPVNSAYHPNGPKDRAPSSPPLSNRRGPTGEEFDYDERFDGRIV
jgi:hypothetical protein